MSLYFKKIAHFVLVFAMLLSLFSGIILNPPKAKALYEGEQDGACLLAPTGYWYFTNWRILHQWWRPLHNQINEFWMYADTTGGGSFNLNIKEWLNGTQVATATGTASGLKYGWIPFDFPNVGVKQGELYYASITGTYPNRWWYHDPDDCWQQNMTAGVTGNEGAGVMTFYYDQDFVFYVYGQEASAPAEEDAPPSDPPPADAVPDSDPGGVATGSDQPVTSGDTISSINPPATVTANDVPDDEGNAIKLSWAKSDSSGITGYRVYRSDAENGTYTRLGSVKSGILEFIDNGAETGKKFWYVVRSYNSKGESKDSNKVSMTSADNLAPKTPQDLKAAYNTSAQSIDLTWTKNVELDLDKYELKYGTAEDKLDKTVEVKKDKSSYELLDIKGNTTYYFEITAKDTHGNTSSPAKANAKAPEGVKTSWLDYVLTPINYIGAAVIVFLGLLLTYLILRRKKLRKVSPKIVEPKKD